MTGKPIERKKIHQGKKAQDKLRTGIDLVADIIKQTLCPKGRNAVVQERLFLNPRSMNDGHYIAQNIRHDDPTINAGVKMVKEICSNTNERVGDGTTTTALLAQSIINEGFKAIEKGRNPVDVKNELNADLIKILAHLKSISRDVKTNKDIENVATISGNNDVSIGTAIGGIKKILGRNAPIITERHDKTNIETETVEGVYFKEGYGEKRAFVSNGGKRTGELREDSVGHVRVLCLDDEMSDINELSSFVRNVITWYKSININIRDFKLLVVAKIANPAAAPVVMLAQQNIGKLENRLDENNKPWGFRNIVIEAPRCAGFQPDTLEDIALATGGKVVGQRHGTKLKDVDPKLVLGTAKRVIVSRKTTIITGGGGDKEKVKHHVIGLEKELEDAKTDEKRKSLNTRLNMLSSGIGIIKAGGVTDYEAGERELRIEDAILATRAAIEEGITVGGGNTYYQLSKIAKSPILKRACMSIPEQIAKNAGVKFNDTGKTKNGYGYNAINGEYQDLLTAGVIDATKVIRVALENAVSFSSLLLTTSASIIHYEDQ